MSRERPSGPKGISHCSPMESQAAAWQGPAEPNPEESQNQTYPLKAQQLRLMCCWWQWVTCQPFPHVGFASIFRSLCACNNISKELEHNSDWKVNTWLLFFTLPFAMGDRIQSMPDMLDCLVADSHIFNYILKYAKEIKRLCDKYVNIKKGIWQHLNCFSVW